MLFLGCFLHQEITFSMQEQYSLKKDMCQAKWWCPVKGYTDPDEPVTSNKKEKWQISTNNKHIIKKTQPT
jgi:hypothetical protein